MIKCVDRSVFFNQPAEQNIDDQLNMGSMFRSDRMAMCQIFMQSETVYKTVAVLGEIGLVQFKDVSIMYEDVNN